MPNEATMQHGHDYTDQRVKTWIACEKLDGCRVFWDGRKLWTRGGYSVPAPARFLDKLPANVPLDGELWAGRGGFQTARVACQYGRWRDEVRFTAFDSPGHQGHYLERIAHARTVYGDCVETVTIRSAAHAWSLANAIVEHGGEGLILRDPVERGYRAGRSRAVLKLKPVTMALV